MQPKRSQESQEMKILIVEVKGGVVQEVYTDATNLQVMLIDWDAGESPGEEYAGGRVWPLPLSKLPAETVEAIVRVAL